MPIVADTHVHIYPCYSMLTLLKSAVDNLNRFVLDSGAETGGRAEWVKVVFLAERYDCHLFRRISESGLGLDERGYTVRSTSERDLLLVECGGQSLHIAAGRQIVTKERLEILALTVDMEIEDGLPAREVVDRVNGEGGVPVLSWAPGKWFFGRGAVVSELIETFQPGELLVGDTTLRPTCWLEPRLMRHARLKGLKLIAGSDPLPFEGEEKRVGTYGIVYGGNLDAGNPATSLRNILKDTTNSVSLVGARSGLADVVTRLKKNRDSKKEAGAG